MIANSDYDEKTDYFRSLKNYIKNIKIYVKIFLEKTFMITIKTGYFNSLKIILKTLNHIKNIKLYYYLHEKFLGEIFLCSRLKRVTFIMLVYLIH